MKLQNVTLVTLVTDALGKYNIGWVTENPTVPSKNGVPCIGVRQRRLMTVKEIVKRFGFSKSKAAELRRELPLGFLVEFPGQKPLADLLRRTYVPELLTV